MPPEVNGPAARPEWPAGRMVRPSRAPEPPLLRFDRRERALHWVSATLFGILMFTGAALYSGLALPVMLLVSVLGRRGARLRRDLGRLNRWTRDDARWFRRGNRSSVQLGKFNPGQKLNAAFIAGAGLVMLATGAIMKWFEPFPLDWRTGATFVHDWFALGIWLAVLGHIFFALRDGDALEGMLKGDVPATWARTKAPQWYDEVRTASTTPDPDAEPNTS